MKYTQEVYDHKVPANWAMAYVPQGPVMELLYEKLGYEHLQLLKDVDDIFNASKAEFYQNIERSIQRESLQTA